MAVTQQQIADELGVSRVWVTRALNNHPKVSKRGRLLVQETARRMGYDEHSNRDARSLIARRYGKRLKSGIIAVLTSPHYEGVPLREEPYYMALLEGIEGEAARHEMDVFLCSPRDQKLPRLISNQMVDGIIGIALGSEVWQQCNELDLPQVSLVTYDETSHRLEPQDEQGAFELTSYLLGLGHRHIAFLSQPLNHVPFGQIAATRFNGYRRALLEAGLPLNKKLIIDSLPGATIEGGKYGIERLLADTRKATAIFGVNDLVAMGAMLRAEEMNIEVPRDLSIAGFDDYPMYYGATHSVTSVSFSRREMGKRAVQLLSEEIKRIDSATDEGVPYELRTESFEPRLVIRESTAPPAKTRRQNK